LRVRELLVAEQAEAERTAGRGDSHAQQAYRGDRGPNGEGFPHGGSSLVVCLVPDGTHDF
jgi:hypothetical protein